MSINIRQEQPSDQQVIWEITKAAFEGRPYAGGDEQDLVNTLRDLGVLTLSLVATDDDEVVGQATFSPVSISSGIGSWFALGPISVRPDRQSEGIGGLLIEAGINELQALGAWGCILTGNPDYYSRHGFKFADDHCPEKEQKEYFMLRLIGAEPPDGVFAFHDAFYGE